MMYQALYRKYRPKTFDDVVGQEHITETLKKQVETGRLSHAYLFIGTRGTGKTTCAKILAKAVNCEHPVNGNPCNQCAACRGIDDGSILDVVEIDAASNNRVEDVRALRDEAVFSPANVNKRVYIIDEVHMLDIECFTYLNRALESAFAPVVIFASNRGMCVVKGTDYTSPHGIPVDLLDRSLIIRTTNYTVKEMITIISIRAVTEGIELQDDALAEIGIIGARTSLRYCIQLLAPARILAETYGRKVIQASDIKEVDELFLDSKRSVKRLTENKDKYLE